MPAKPAKQPVVTCPQCGQGFPITEALTRELVAPLMDGLREEVAKEVRAGLDEDLEAMRRKSQDQAEQITELTKQRDKLRGAEEQLRRDRRRLEDEKDDLKRKTEEIRDEVTKQERDRADQQAARHVEEERRRLVEERREQDRVKDARHQDERRELEQKLERANRALEELERKTRTGSGTEQGYARQDVFGRELAERFRQDGVTPIPRGRAGADIKQLVRLGAAGCGTILWEVKRAKTWQPGWIDKLITNRDKARALVGVIVTEALPPGIDGFAERDGVWITGFGDALNLAGVLREIVITAWKRDTAAGMRDENAEKIYDYVMSGPFARRLDSLSRVAARLLNEVRLDKNALEQRWRRTERLIGELIEVRAAIPLDLLERLDSGTELPPGLRAELPPGGSTPELPAALGE